MPSTPLPTTPPTRRPPHRTHQALLGLLFFSFILTGQGLTLPTNDTISFSFLLGTASLLILLPRYLDFSTLDIPDTLFISFLLLLILSSLANLFSHSPTPRQSGLLVFGSLRPLIHTSRFLLLFLFYKTTKVYLQRTPHPLVRLRPYVITTAVFLALYGTYQYFASLHQLPFATLNTIHKPGLLSFEAGAVPRLFATFGEPKGYGIFLLFFVPLLIAYSSTSKHQALYTSLLMILLTHAIFTFSESTYFAILAGTVALFLLFFLRTSTTRTTLSRRTQPSHSLPSPLILLALAALVASFFVPVGDNTVAGQFSTILTGDYAPSSTVGQTVRQLDRAWSLALDRPLLGHGPGAFFTEAREQGWVNFRNQIIGPKSLLAYLLANTGLLGTITALAFLLTPIFQAIAFQLRSPAPSAHRAFHAFVLYGAIMVTIQLLIQSGLNEIFLWFNYALLAAMNTTNLAPPPHTSTLAPSPYQADPIQPATPQPT